MINNTFIKFTSKIKIGLDVHGVIDGMPDFFAFLTDSFIKNGAEVHIITGSHWDSKLEETLKSLNIKWTHGFSIYDYLIETNAEIIGEIQFPDGAIQKKFDGDLWDSIKSIYCKEHGITLHIDDTQTYNKYFSTPFAKLWVNNSKVKISHKDI